MCLCVCVSVCLCVCVSVCELENGRKYAHAHVLTFMEHAFLQVLEDCCIELWKLQLREMGTAVQIGACENKKDARTHTTPHHTTPHHMRESNGCKTTITLSRDFFVWY